MPTATGAEGTVDVATTGLFPRGAATVGDVGTAVDTAVDTAAAGAFDTVTWTEGEDTAVEFVHAAATRPNAATAATSERWCDRKTMISRLRSVAAAEDSDEVPRVFAEVSVARVLHVGEEPTAMD